MLKTKLYTAGIVLVLAMLVFCGCGDKAGANEQNEQTPVSVEVIEVSKPDSRQLITYSGTIEESETVPLSFQTPGNITKVMIKEGDFVKRGQALAVINSENYRSSYDMALASLKQAEDAYKRLQPMYKNGNLPEIKMIEVETSLQQAKSAVAIAKKNIDDCTLKSPIDGYVGKKNIDPGMGVMPGIAAINIVKIEKVYARIPVPENEIASIKKGERANVKIGALNGLEVSGIVEEIGVMADPLAHSYKIKIAIINKDKKLKPGMICNVVLPNSIKSDELVVPNKSVLMDNKGSNFVYVINANNKAEKRMVQVGGLLNSGIIINSGLASSEKVVISGQNKIVENSLVNIINK